MKKKTRYEAKPDDAASVEFQDRMRAALADLGLEIEKLPPTRRAVLVRVFDKAKRRVEDALRYEYQSKWRARHETSAVATEYMGKAIDLTHEKRALERTLLAAKSGADCFILNNHFYTVQINGVLLPALKESVGLRYLAFLFSRPGHEYSFRELFEHVAWKAPVNKESDDQILKDIEPMPEQIAYRRGQQGFCIRQEHEAADTLSPDDWKKIEGYKQRLERDLAAAVQRGDKIGTDEARRELAEAEKGICKLYGTRARPRSYHYAGEAMRSEVSKSIHRAFRVIAGQSKPLAELMRARFKSMGGCWSYRA